MNNIVTFFVQRVILNKTMFAEVPAKLQEQVKEMLINMNFAEFIVEE